MPIETEYDRVVKHWEKCKKYGKAINLLTTSLFHRTMVFQDAIAIDPTLAPEIRPWVEDIEKSQQDNAKIQKIITDVELGKLGLRESSEKPGDIDLMAPPGTPNEQLIDYNIGIVLLLIGIVVAVGLVATFAYMTAKAKKADQYKRLFDVCDQKLSGNPEWDEKKKTVFAERKTTWERLESAANQVLGGASSGLMLGIAALIVGYVWSKK